MRFSLATLLIVMLWAGALVGVWQRNAPWIQDGRRPENFNLLQYLGKLGTSDNFEASQCFSPDGRRTARNPAPYAPEFDILERNSQRILCKTVLADGRIPMVVNFIDNDTLLVLEIYKSGVPKGPVFWHRRYPEWWWGHFYRPEVWPAIVFGALWIWRIVRWYRMRRSRSF